MSNELPVIDCGQLWARHVRTHVPGSDLGEKARG
jgi:hypothetical protein